MGSERTGVRRGLALVFLILLAAGLRSSADAQVAAAADTVPFLIRFHTDVHGLSAGAPVEIRGIRVGEVASVAVDYDPAANSFVVPVRIDLHPSLFPGAGEHPRTLEETYAAAETLVERGLRAQLGDTAFLGGQSMVVLAIQPDLPPATLGRAGPVPEIPAGPSKGDLIAQKLEPLLDKVANLPIDELFEEAKGTMVEARAAAAELRGVVQRLGPKSDVLIGHLDTTLKSTTKLIDHTDDTLVTIEHQVGDRSPLLADLRGTLQELQGTARSMRLLAEYLERNPNALLVGKSDNRR